VATNGVLHVIDALIIPASARPLEAVVKERTEKLLKVLDGGDAAALADRLAAKLADLKGQSLKKKKKNCPDLYKGSSSLNLSLFLFKNPNFVNILHPAPPPKFF
jgi:hypothetical protein